MKALKLSIAFFLRSWALGFLLLTGCIILLNDPHFISISTLRYNQVFILLLISFVFSLPVLPPLFIVLLLFSPWHYPKAYQLAFFSCMGLFLSFGWMSFLALHTDLSLLHSGVLLPFVCGATLAGTFINKSKLFHRLSPQPGTHA